MWSEETLMKNNPSLYNGDGDQKSLLQSDNSTYIPPSRKLQTFSSLLETRWKVSLMICCSVSSFCEDKQNREIRATIKNKVPPPYFSHQLLSPLVSSKNDKVNGFKSC